MSDKYFRLDSKEQDTNKLIHWIASKGVQKLILNCFNENKLPFIYDDSGNLMVHKELSVFYDMYFDPDYKLKTE